MLVSLSMLQSRERCRPLGLLIQLYRLMGTVFRYWDNPAVLLPRQQAKPVSATT